MSGPALAEAMRARIPGMPVLFMSGHADDAVLRHGVTGADLSLLQKPFDTKMLTRSLRRVLDNARSANLSHSL